jgi:hypothetical protein
MTRPPTHIERDIMRDCGGGGGGGGISEKKEEEACEEGATTHEDLLQIHLAVDPTITPSGRLEGRVMIVTY